MTERRRIDLSFNAPEDFHGYATAMWIDCECDPQRIHVCVYATESGGVLEASVRRMRESLPLRGLCRRCGTEGEAVDAAVFELLGPVALELDLEARA